MTCSITGKQDDESVIEGVMAGDYRLVFFTPEMLIGKTKWRKVLLGDAYSSRLRSFVVDEAHTIKTW